ncbi:MAG TPA: leucyl/phenylalanyl-tRNA--protein transferase [Pyrinomonadaceae bacterium]|nr:leucyl/phenylalanyl-tRNA--protein transferase [Pyrinomonadaceae bacterium]
MRRSRFPDPRDANEDGIVALGGSLDPETLLDAYRHGIFPWPFGERYVVPWVSPAVRAVLDFDRLHIPRSLARERRRAQFHFTFDRDFESVIKACAVAPRSEGPGTWITRGMIRGYTSLHRLGHAHSVEVWEGETLVGGMYGVDAGGAFAGESMFYLRPNASKLALLHLVEHLRTRGLEWLDVQVLTPHIAALGAIGISREEFLERLAETRARGLVLFPRAATE